ncbi:MAG: PQQ-like beta-propeller repeat protein [Verrucomicrobiales bacterium]|nr:PQQ-like beta-propeller repeat protein [Verrucomicrobiales bacterium]
MLRSTLMRTHLEAPSTRIVPVPLPPSRSAFGILRLATLLAVTVSAAAEDWPQWMGPRRDGVWRESGVLTRFDSNGPPKVWSVPVRAGYVGPAVAQGRLYLLDRETRPAPERKKGERALPEMPGTERVLCLDAAKGSTIWEHVYDRPYRIAYPAGPRATPLVDVEARRLFTLGAMGDLKCLSTQDGTVLWAIDLPGRYRCEPPVWGYAAHPLLVRDRLVVPVGGTNSALVAFDPASGREVWRALGAREIGYAPPIVAEVAGRSQIVFWHPDAVTGLDPATGTVLWSHPYPVGGKPQRPEVTIAQPRIDGDRLLLTSFYQGSLLLRIPGKGEDPRPVWNRRSSKPSEIDDGLHTVMSTPFISEGCIFGICAFGELRCLDLASGDRLWESLDVFDGKGGFFAHAFVVEQGGRHWIWNDQGELMLGKFSKTGFERISKAKILETRESTRGRDVLWCHPAFADRSMWVHNGRELVRLDLVERS